MAYQGGTLTELNSRFKPLSAFQSEPTTAYSLLPLRFLRLDSSRYFLSNFAGEFVVLSEETMRAFLTHQLVSNSSEYQLLKSRHFLLDSRSSVALELLAAKYRTRMAHLRGLTSLFLFVTTLRCDHSCGYCQVSRRSENKTKFDMSGEVAEKAVDFVFESSSVNIKLEFQGGESLLNFPRIQQIVELVEKRNVEAKKNIAFVVATSLSGVSDAMLHYCRDHDVLVSTSVDGPEALHNANRHRPGRDSYKRAVDGIRRARSILGPERVSALMTTTQLSLGLPKEIVDEYVMLGFSSIFLRSISPYGFAARSSDSYDFTQWFAFYRVALEHIIELNKGGITFREELATLLLRKLLTPFPTHYVDLQSPAGVGLSCLVFNYDGKIYASDEGRMLAEMKDETFWLGTLGEVTYADVMSSRKLYQPIAESLTDSVPGCSECALQPFCGSDPTFHHATQKDFVGRKPISFFCKRTMGVGLYLVKLMEDDTFVRGLFRRWVSQ